MHRLSVFRSLIKQEKAALFIGAGISNIAGCAGLHAILQKLSTVKNVQESIISQKPDVPTKELMAFYRSICNKSDEDRRKFDGIMREALTNDPERYYREYIPFIKKLKQLMPFPSIVTTNVDSCLTHSRQFDVTKIYYKVADMRLDLFRNIGIFHLHGYVEDSSSQVWDLYDYPKRYSVQEFKVFISNIFREYSVLFLGYAFGEDEELRELIAQAKKDSPQPPTHYALLPTDEPHPRVNEAIYEELFNIKIIKYGKKADFVGLLSDWLDSNFNPKTMGGDPSHIPEDN